MKMNKKVNKNSKKPDLGATTQWRRRMGKDFWCSPWRKGGSLVAGVGDALRVGVGNGVGGKTVGVLLGSGG